MTTFTTLGKLIAKGEQVPAAAKSLRTLTRASWPKDQANDVARGIIAWAKGIPTGERTSPEYVATVQLAGDLAGVLPAIRQPRSAKSCAMFGSRCLP